MQWLYHKVMGDVSCKIYSYSRLSFKNLRRKKKIVDADVLKLTPTQMFVFVVVSLKFRLNINRLFLFSFHEGSTQS